MLLLLLLLLFSLSQQSLQVTVTMFTSHEHNSTLLLGMRGTTRANTLYRHRSREIHLFDQKEGSGHGSHPHFILPEQEI